MSTDEECIIVGEPMPRLASVHPAGEHRVCVSWIEGPRAGRSETVDLGPVLSQYRFYARLRTDSALFATVRIDHDGNALSWDEGRIDLSAVLVEHLARLTEAAHMSAEQFRDWMERHHLTCVTAADALGIARRLIACYVSGEKSVPRTVALACAGYDSISRQAA